MTALPLALRPWAGPLSALDPSLAVALGPMLTRLSAALGPLGGETARGGDEPDGYAGISRRGPLERLLTSEWALLNEVPDEFLRRFSSGELAYFELERTAPAHERRCLLLFDSGPDQLGAPRIAHLAAWIVLARRAESAGATLQWASLTDPPSDESLRSGIGTGEGDEGIRAFLDARSLKRPTPQSLYEWRKFAHATLGSSEEITVIGGPRWRELPMARGIRLLSVAESGEALAVEISPGPKSLSLPLPAPDVQIRLLRDPFARRAGKSPGPSGAGRRSAAASMGAPVWLPDGRGFCVRVHGGIACYSVPRKPGEHSGSIRLYAEPYGKIVAVGGFRRCIFTLVRQGNNLSVRQRRGWTAEIETQFYPLAPEAIEILDALPDDLIDCRWRGRYLEFQVLSAGPFGLSRDDDNCWTVFKVPLEPTNAALALEAAGFLTLDPLETLIGWTKVEGQMRFVTRSAAGRLVKLVRPDGAKVLTGIGGAVKEAAVSPDRPLLACVREDGSVVVWDLESNVARCRFEAPR